MVVNRRLLLVTAAALSTVLVGLRGTFVAAAAPGAGVRAVSSREFDGSREDDSGTPSEQVEEDDGEEEVRDVHLSHAAVPPCRLDAPVRFANSTPQRVLVGGVTLATHVRGPPRG